MAGTTAPASGATAPEPRRPRGPRTESLLVHRLARWFDARLGAARLARTTLNKVFPDHWSFLLGELGLYRFVLPVLTGVSSTFFYVLRLNHVTYDYIPAPPPRTVLRRPPGRRPPRPHDAQQGLPRPLVVHVGRAGALQLRRAGADRRLPDLLLRAQQQRRHLRRQLRAPAGGRDDRGLPVRAPAELRRSGRPGHAPDPPLGGAAVPRLAGRPRGPGVLHRGLPAPAGAQLGDRLHAAGPGTGQRALRLLAARRPAVGHGPADRVLDRAVDPARRHLDHL